MYHEDEAVPLPPKDHRVLQKSKKCTYVYYFTDRHYDSKRGCTVDNRVAVGKLCPDGETMWPNDRWYELSLSTPEPSDVAKHRNVGVYLGIRKACESIGLLDAMRDVLPEQWDVLLALTTYAIDDRGSGTQRFCDWRYHNYCGLTQPISDTAISDLFEYLADHERKTDELSDRFRQAYRKAMPQQEGVAIMLDTTSDPYLSQALIIDGQTGIPLCIEECLDSITDIAETADLAERMRTFGFDQLRFAIDSTDTTDDEIETLSNCACEFSMLVSNSHDAYASAMSEKSQEVRLDWCYMGTEDCYGTAIKSVPCLGGICDVHLFYDMRQALCETNSIHQQAISLLDLANNQKEYTERFRDTFAPYITVTKTPKDPITGKNFRAEFNTDYLQTEIDDVGYFAVVASPGLTSKEVLRTERLRERIEKEYDQLLTSLSTLASSTNRAHTLTSTTFMSFLALVAYESFRYYTSNPEKDSLTCTLKLAELRKLQCHQDSKGKARLATTLTKEQREIFACLGMDVATVTREVASLPF